MCHFVVFVRVLCSRVTGNKSLDEERESERAGAEKTNKQTATIIITIILRSSLVAV